MPQLLERLNPYIEAVEKILREAKSSPILMAKVFIENTLLSDGDKKELEDYAYSYFTEIVYRNQD